jgi:ABC-type lipoprotein release transport system permease subunit
VFIGSEKAKELASHLGDPVQLITPIGRLTPAGRIPGVMKVKVAGVFDANHYEYDRWLVYANLPLAQAFLRAGDRVSGVEVKVDDPDRLAERKQQVQAVVDRLGRTDLQVQDWQELNLSLFSAMALEKIAVFIALLCVILVASIGILGSNLMSVLEKSKEIAILKTMGCTDRLIQRVFISEGLCLGVLGGVLGILAGVALCLVLDRYGLPLGGSLQGFEQLPVAIDPLEIVLVGLSSLLIVFLSSLYPAWVASHMRPVDALRQGER